MSLKSDPQTPTCGWGLWIILSLYLLKVVYIGIFVTSPWDVPDEIGHLGYIKALASGEGIPVLMETKLDEEMWKSMTGQDTPPSHNWIAQHPPLYYAIMVPSYWIGSMLGDSFESPLYAGRICNGLLMVLALYVLSRMVLLFSGSEFTTLGVVAMVGSIPLASQTAAGVSNDALIILLSACLAWRWMHFSKTPHTRNLLVVGLVIGLCGITKYTFLPIMAALSALVIWRWVQVHGISATKILSFLALAWLPIFLWVVRNLRILGKALPADLDYLTFESSTDYNVVEFLENYPFFTHLFRSFWGIFGWHGSGKELVLTTMHLPVFYQILYALLVCILAFLSLRILILRGKTERPSPTHFSFVVSGLLTTGIYSLDVFPKEAFYVSAVLYLALFSSQFAILFGATQLWFISRSFPDWRIRIQVESILVCAFFLIVITFKLINYGNDSGMLRGTHGRYFFSGIGFLLIAWIIPGLTKTTRSTLLGCSVAGLMIAAEYSLWIAEVIPFFESR